MEPKNKKRRGVTSKHQGPTKTAPKTTQQQAKIEAPEGWNVQSAYGTLKDVRGARLVRLEDIHAWLMTNKELSSTNAAAWIFSAFTFDAGSPIGLLHGAAAVRTTLRILHPAESAAEYSDYLGSLYFNELTTLFPYVPHHQFDRDTPEALLYAMGNVAGYVWAPAMQDGPEVDLNECLDSYTAEGDFPSADVCRNRLGRLAVTFQAAHQLWGWGAVADVVTLQAVHIPIDKEPSTFAELVRFRKEHKGSGWTPTQKEIVAAEANTRKDKPGARGVASGMAEELEITITRLNELIRNVELVGKRAVVRRVAPRI